MTVPNDSKFTAAHLRTLSFVSHLHIHTSAHNVVHLSGLVVRSPALQILELEASEHECCSSPRQQTPASAGASGTILGTLFSGTQAGQHERAAIRTINLKGFNFQSSSLVLAGIAKLCDLETLILQQCCSVLTLLQAFRCSGVSQTLRQLLITSEFRIESRPRTAVSEMDEFIAGSTELQSLIIDAPLDAILEPTIASLSLPSLEILMLQCHSPIEHDLDAPTTSWTRQQVEAMVMRCPNISNLGINFPHLSIMHKLNENGFVDEAPEYGEFAVSEESRNTDRRC